MKTANRPIPRRTHSALGCALVFLAATATALAVPLWDIDLDSMTAGQTITTAAYINGTVNTSPQSVGTFAAGSGLITEDFTVGSATLSGNSVVLKKNSGGTASTVRFTMSGSAADYTNPTDYEMSFDMLASQSVFDTDTSFRVQMMANSTGTIVGYIVLKKNGGLEINSNFGTAVELTSVWTWGEVFNVKLQLDADNGLFNVGINDTLVGSITLTDPELGIRHAWFGVNSNNSLFADGIGIQNIVTSTTLTGLQVVPEPATFAALAGLGVLGLAVTRRRRA